MKNFKFHFTAVAIATMAATSTFAADNGLILFGNNNANVKETTALQPEQKKEESKGFFSAITAPIAALGAKVMGTSKNVAPATTDKKPTSSFFQTKNDEKYIRDAAMLLDDDLLFKKSIPDLQAQLNAVVKAKFTDNNGNIVCNYHVNKAQAWLDMSRRSQDLVKSVTPATYHSFEQAYKLIHMLKDGVSSLPKDTPAVKYTSEIRIDLHAQLKSIATSNACGCAKAQIGTAEVFLVDASRFHHEDRRHDEAQRLEREAERVIESIQNTDRQCVADVEAARLAKIEAQRKEAERLAQIEATRLEAERLEAQRVIAEKEALAAEAVALAATQVAVAPIPEVIPVQQISFGTDALFKFNGGTTKDITTDGLVKIQDFVAKLQEVKTIDRVLVEGHADRFGRDPYNEGLSVQRANSIASILVDKGVNANIIQVQGYGENRPLVECNGKKSKTAIQCLQPNRRVELKVFGGK